MLASFIIIYILVRVNLDPNPSAPTADPKPHETDGMHKGALFGAFLTIMGASASGVLLLRALFFLVTGQYILEEGEDPISLGMPYRYPLDCRLAGRVSGHRASGVRQETLRAQLEIRERSCGPVHHHRRCPRLDLWRYHRHHRSRWHGQALAVFLISIIMDRSWGEWKAFVAQHIIKIIGVIIGTAIVSYALATYMGGESKAVWASTPFIIMFFYWCMRAPGKVPLVWDGLMRTLRSTGTIIWVTIGAAALAGAYTLAGGPTFIANMIVGSEMPTMLVLLMMMLILLFMGAFMDWVGIVLLIIPVFLPIVKRLPIEEIGFIGQLDPKYLSVWFGVLFCMNMQVSFLSPPFGPAAFYLKSVAPPHISLTDIFRGFLPFICIQLCALAVMLIWPPIVEILLP